MKKPFERVVAEHGATVLRVCRAVLGPHLDADDAWSETFVAAMRAWPDLPDDVNVEAWLVTIAHRKAIDITRARQRQPVVVERIPEGESIPEPDPVRLDLWRGLEALPDKQRMAVAYHYLGGLPYRAVADLLGGTTDAARRAAADGIRALRGRLAPEASDDRPGKEQQGDERQGDEQQGDEQQGDAPVRGREDDDERPTDELRTGS